MKKPNIEFEFTCEESLDENDFCHKCQHHVVDLSKLTPSEIENILAKENVCVTALYDERDQLVTRPEPRSFWQRVALGASLVTLLGCEPESDDASTAENVSTKQIAMATPPKIEAPAPIVHNHTQATDLDLDERCGDYVFSDQTAFERIQAARNVRDGNVEKGTDLEAMSSDELADEWAYEQTVELGVAYREVYKREYVSERPYRRRLRGRVKHTHTIKYD